MSLPKHKMAATLLSFGFQTVFFDQKSTGKTLMPGLGYIYENGERDIWGLKTYPPPEEFKWCPHCKFFSKNKEDLHRHISANHPMDVPVLMLRGRELPRNSTWIQRSLTNPDDLFLQATTIELQRNVTPNGPWKKLTREKFIDGWCSERNSQWRIRLTRHRYVDEANAHSGYTVQFRIPKEEIIRDIDKNFVKMLSVTTPTRAILNSFLERYQKYEEPEREYAGALCQYVHAVLLKENPQVVSSYVKPFESVILNLKNSLEILKLFDTELAKRICACIRFNLNFAEIPSQTLTMPKLHIAMDLFRQVAANVSTIKFNDQIDHINWSDNDVSIHPIDRDTALALKTCEALVNIMTSSKNGKIAIKCRQSLKEVSEMLEERLSLGKIMETDLIKFHILGYLCWYHLEQQSKARRHLIELKGNSSIEPWVEKQLG